MFLYHNCFASVYSNVLTNPGKAMSKPSTPPCQNVWQNICGIYIMTTNQVLLELFIKFNAIINN